MQQEGLSSSAAAIIDGNDDLLTEILVLLPAKSLLRLRAVSKHLSSLIDDESFRRRHLVNCRRRRPPHQFILRSTESPHQIFLCDITAKTLLPLRPEPELKSGRRRVSMLTPFMELYRHVRVLQSCHGLLLLDCRRSSHAYIDIYVYNPITAQRTSALLHLPRYDRSRFCLIYDPSKSNGYTVFRFVSCGLALGRVDVYDSRTRKWEIGKATYDQPRKRLRQGVLCNGRLYFIRPHSPTLMCFSPENLHFSAVANPPLCPSTQKNYVVESNGHLHCLVPSLSLNENYIDVYELIDDERWGLQLRAWVGVGRIEVLGFVRGDERVEDSILVYQVLGKRKIMVYGFGDRVSEEIVGLPDLPSEFGFKQLIERLPLEYLEFIAEFGFKPSHQIIDSLPLESGFNLSHQCNDRLPLEFGFKLSHQFIETFASVS